MLGKEREAGECAKRFGQRNLKFGISEIIPQRQHPKDRLQVGWFDQRVLKFG